MLDDGEQEIQVLKTKEKAISSELAFDDSQKGEQQNEFKELQQHWDKCRSKTNESPLIRIAGATDQSDLIARGKWSIVPEDKLKTDRSCYHSNKSALAPSI